MKKLSRYALLPLFCLLVAACTSAAAKPAKEASSMRELSFEVMNASGDAARTFAPGETVQFAFRLRNPGDATKQYSFTFPPHRVTVTDANGETVWTAWQGRMFPQVMRDQAIAPGESETFLVEWQIPDDLSGELRAVPEFNAFAGRQKLAAKLESVMIRIEGKH